MVYNQENLRGKGKKRKRKRSIPSLLTQHVDTNSHNQRTLITFTFAPKEAEQIPNRVLSQRFQQSLFHFGMEQFNS
jgi:hypothetical protein